MRFYTTQPPFYCGIDLHARSMDVCVLRHEGDIPVAPPHASGSGTLPQGRGALSRRARGGRRVSLYLVRAR